MNVWFRHCPRCGQKSVAVGHAVGDYVYEGQRHRVCRPDLAGCGADLDVIVTVTVPPLVLVDCERAGHDWTVDDRRCARCGGVR